MKTLKMLFAVTGGVLWSIFMFGVLGAMIMGDENPSGELIQAAEVIPYQEPEWVTAKSLMPVYTEDQIFRAAACSKGFDELAFRERNANAPTLNEDQLSSLDDFGLNASMASIMMQEISGQNEKISSLGYRHGSEIVQFDMKDETVSTVMTFLHSECLPVMVIYQELYEAKYGDQ